MLNNPLKYVDPTGKWSTKSIPRIAQPVHQMAIQRVLGTEVQNQYIEIMNLAQEFIDAHQKNTEQFMHAITGEGQLKSDAIQNANLFVKTTLSNAKEAYESGDFIKAFSYLGLAIHPLQEASSPSHSVFPAYNLYSSEPNHSRYELKYPGEGTWERRYLEGATEWGYDIVTGRASMPPGNFFFEPDTGKLLIPEGYVRPEYQPSNQMMEIMGDMNLFME